MRKKTNLKDPILAFGRFINVFRRYPWIEKRLLVSKLYVTEYEYTHPDFPAEPVTLLYVTDIHAGPYFTDQQSDTLLRVMRKSGCGLILFGGDFGEKPFNGLEWLSSLPLFPDKEMFMVPGNHDTIKEGDLAKLQAMTEKKGIRMLRNDAVRMPGGWTLAGLDDFRAGKPDPEKLRGKVKDDPFVLLLSHNPDILPDITPPFYQLALCGHTHGGQVAIGGKPIFSSSIYRSRFSSGWKEEQGADVLISNGVGVSLLPVRIAVRPQVLLVTLRQGEKGHKTIRETEAQHWLRE